MPKELGLLCVLVLLSSASGLANDSSAELATGGLVFTKSDDIDLLSEDLFVSMKPGPGTISFLQPLRIGTLPRKLLFRCRMYLMK